MNRREWVRWFRIYPNSDRRRFYKVFVFKEKGDMVAFWEAQVRTGMMGRQDEIGGFEAQATCFIRKNSHGKVLPTCGQLLFYAGSVGSGIVAHEMSHAAFYYLERFRPKFRPRSCRDDEESLAWATGYLVNQFWNKFYEMGDWKKWTRPHPY